jgi:hypothetical protein
MMWRNFCYPEFAGGLNIPSLIDAQRSYARIGAIEERLLNDVRAPLETETKAPDWKPLDASIHTIEPRRPPQTPPPMAGSNSSSPGDETG